MPGTINQLGLSIWRDGTGICPVFPGITGTINQDMADVEALGIRQTPTFFLNGKRLENFSAESLIADVKFAVENA